MENYEKLKQVIQQANPEIMELKFGCEVDIKAINPGPGDTDWNNSIIVQRWFPAEGGASYQILGSEEVFTTDYEPPQSADHYFAKILGRPIRLADVLLALGMFGEMLAQTDWRQSKLLELLEDGWNLKDDNLDHQSEETKQFLINLLLDAV